MASTCYLYAREKEEKGEKRKGEEQRTPDAEMDGLGCRDLGCAAADRVSHVVMRLSLVAAFALESRPPEHCKSLLEDKWDI